MEFRINELDVGGVVGLLGARTLTRLTHLSVVDVAPGTSLARLMSASTRVLRSLESLGFSRTPPALDAGALPGLTSLLASDLRTNMPADDRLRWLATVTDASLGEVGGYNGVNALLRHLPRLSRARIFVQQWTRRMELPNGLAHATALLVAVVRESYGYLEPTGLSLNQLTGLAALTSLRVEKMGYTHSLVTSAPLAALRNLELTLISCDFTFPSSLPALTRLVLASSALPSSPLKLSVAPLATVTAPALQLLMVSGFQLVALSTNAADACGDAAAVEAMTAYAAAAAAHVGAVRSVPTAKMQQHDARLARHVAQGRMQEMRRLAGGNPAGDAAADAAEAAFQAARAREEVANARVAEAEHAAGAKERTEEVLNLALGRAVVDAIPRALPSLRVFHLHNVATSSEGSRALQQALEARTEKSAVGSSRDACASCGV